MIAAITPITAIPCDHGDRGDLIDMDPSRRSEFQK